MAIQTFKYVLSVITAAVTVQGQMFKKQQLDFKDVRTELQGNELLRFPD